jgi:hypothetical protein
VSSQHEIENTNNGVPIIWWGKTLSAMSLAATVLNVVLAVALPPGGLSGTGLPGAVDSLLSGRATTSAVVIAGPPRLLAGNGPTLSRVMSYVKIYIDV